MLSLLAMGTKAVTQIWYPCQRFAFGDYNEIPYCLEASSRLQAVGVRSRGSGQPAALASRVVQALQHNSFFFLISQLFMFSALESVHVYNAS